MNAIDLTREDYAEMIARAFETCPDLDDDEAVMQHLFWLRLAISPIGATAFDALLDEARTSRRAGKRQEF